MEKNFWLKRWQDNQIGFHQSSYHPMLKQFGKFFKPGNVLVPLCGKSLDMLYLASLNHKVIGVELSPIACRDFFKENGISYLETKLQDFILFESEYVTLWCGDFFNLPEDVWANTTGLYDRAALVALPKDIREKYAAEIVKRSKNIETLLISFEYPEDAIEGPPFSVPEDEIKSIFRPLNVHKLLTRPVEKSSQGPQRLQSIDCIEVAYWLTPMNDRFPFANLKN